MADYTFTYRGKSYEVEETDDFYYVYEDGSEICMYCKATDCASTEPSSLSERGVNELLRFLLHLKD